MSERDRPTMLAVLEAVEHIQRYISAIHDADEFYGNEVVFDATLMNFVVIGEMADRLSQELRETHTGVLWGKISSN